MEKTYHPHTIEQHWNHFWLNHHLTEATNQTPAYCIMLPPPNVTGTLHMGHGFQHTLMDALIRRQRMLGKNTLWQPGTDHAGIATQMVVERQLNRQGITRQALGREAFIRKVWEWRDHSGSIITQQIKQLGNSLDWSRERYSMDEPMTRATYEAFIRLHQQGLIYRGHRLVNWDPELLTAISDLEVTFEKRPGHLWFIRYPLVAGEGHLVVATTRPETLLGDMAVAVHPHDERYQHLIGQKLILPLTHREIPIIADDAIDPAFGTGCVKITPAHDFNDYEIGKRHQLPLLNIFTPKAAVNDEAPESYRGLNRFEARKRIVADLKQHNLIEKIEDYEITLPKGDRSGAIIEPLLTNQWYIKMKSLAQPAMDVVIENKLRFTPKNWSKTYLQWLENIQDWCISRQLWWGHQIPVWHDDENNHHYVGLSEDDVRHRYQLTSEVSLRQDEDVLDTWFTASLYPFATLGWPEQTQALKIFYPTQVLVTGFDIIFFWVARMVMMALNLTGDIPFHEVYITGLIRDSQGQKMSKTKGNILDPLDIINGIDLPTLIQKRTTDLIQPEMASSIALSTKKEFPDGIAAYGADALRFTFCALANTGRDINFDMNRIAGYRNFCNKLWNAARFVLMNIKHDDLPEMTPHLVINQWIYSRLQHTLKLVNQFFDDYRFDLIAQAIYEFIWNEYCDWYLELAKCLLAQETISKNEILETESTLINTLETALRLLHPLMPFISEEIWQKIKNRCKKTEISIMVSAYPLFNQKLVDSKAEEEIDWLKQLVSSIRNMRSEIGISPAKKINIVLSKGDNKDKDYLSKYTFYLRALAKINHIEWRQEGQDVPASSATVVNQLEIYLPLADLIDKRVELERLRKEITKLNKEHQHSTQKLSNSNYIEKAPAEVVEKEKQRLQQITILLEKLEQQYVEIETI